MFLKEFEIRWNDLDANRHLANTSYVNYMSHTRMSALSHHGIDLIKLAQREMGPVVFHEHIHYLKEAHQGKVTVSFELAGMSSDGKFFAFRHNFYSEEGLPIATCDMQGGWIDLTTRKLTALPNEWFAMMDRMPKTEDYRILEKADIRKAARIPNPL